MYAIADAVARGLYFAGNKTVQMPIVYVDGENPKAVVKKRFKVLGIPEENPNFGIWGRWVPGEQPGPDDPRIIEFAKEYKPLLIWDSLIQFFHGDENEASEMRPFMDQFRKLADLGATVSVIAHAGKSDDSDYRGSSDIKAAVDTAYKIEKMGHNALLDKIKVKAFKSRYGEERDRILQLISGEGFREVVPDPMRSSGVGTGALKTPLKKTPWGLRQ